MSPAKPRLDVRVARKVEDVVDSVRHVLANRSAREVLRRELRKGGRRALEDARAGLSRWLAKRRGRKTR